jgi:hypothetical protein
VLGSPGFELQFKNIALHYMLHSIRNWDKNQEHTRCSKRGEENNQKAVLLLLLLHAQCTMCSTMIWCPPSDNCTPLQQFQHIYNSMSYASTILSSAELLPPMPCALLLLSLLLLLYGSNAGIPFRPRFAGGSGS